MASFEHSGKAASSNTGPAQRIKPSSYFETHLPVCCIQFCPNYPTYCVVGCYRLFADRRAAPSGDPSPSIHTESQPAAPSDPSTDFMGQDVKRSTSVNYHADVVCFEPDSPRKVIDRESGEEREYSREKDANLEKPLTPILKRRGSCAEKENKPAGSTSNQASTMDDEVSKKMADLSVENETPGEEDEDVPDPPKREGMLYLLQLFHHGGKAQLKPIQSFHYPIESILDISFSKIDPDLLAVATSAGRVYQYIIGETKFEPTTIPASVCLTRYRYFQLLKSPPEQLIHSISWVMPSALDTNHASQARNLLAITSTSGEPSLHYFSLRTGHHLSVSMLEDDARHEDICHTVAWAIHKRTFPPRPILFTGGDDGHLKIHTFMRCETPDGQPFVKRNETISDSKSHNAGVLSILPFPEYDTESRQLVLTGAYDDRVRIYNVFNRQQPVLFELHLGGGVYRLALLRDLSNGKDMAKTPIEQEPLSKLKLSIQGRSSSESLPGELITTKWTSEREQSGGDGNQAVEQDEFLLDSIEDLLRKDAKIDSRWGFPPGIVPQWMRRASTSSSGRAIGVAANLGEPQASSEQTEDDEPSTTHVESSTEHVEHSRSASTPSQKPKVTFKSRFRELVAPQSKDETTVGEERAISTSDAHSNTGSLPPQSNQSSSPRRPTISQESAQKDNETTSMRSQPKRRKGKESKPRVEQRAPSNSDANRTSTSDDVPALHFQVLAACMFAGVKVLDIKRDTKNNWNVSVVAVFNENEEADMTYAAAAGPEISRKRGKRMEPTGRKAVVSGTYYGKKLFVWEMQSP